MVKYYIATNNGMVLMHHGIKGQKCGVRRYQNPDGSLTSAGIVRYRSAETGKASFEGEQRSTYGELQKRSDWKGLNKDERKATTEKFKERKQMVKEDRTTGSKIATTLLLGPFGNGYYNNLRASGVSAANSLGRAWLSSRLGISAVLYARTSKGQGVSRDLTTAERMLDEKTASGYERLDRKRAELYK